MCGLRSVRTAQTGPSVSAPLMPITGRCAYGSFVPGPDVDESGRERRFLREPSTTPDRPERRRDRLIGCRGPRGRERRDPSKSPTGINRPELRMKGRQSSSYRRHRLARLQKSGGPTDDGDNDPFLTFILPGARTSSSILAKSAKPMARAHHHRGIRRCDGEPKARPAARTAETHSAQPPRPWRWGDGPIQERCGLRVAPGFPARKLDIVFPIIGDSPEYDFAFRSPALRGRLSHFAPDRSIRRRWRARRRVTSPPDQGYGE